MSSTQMTAGCCGGKVFIDGTIAHQKTCYWIVGVLKKQVAGTEQTPGDGAFSGFATRKHAAVPGTDLEKGPSQHDSDEEAVNHPKHYTSHPSGVECIQITEHYCNNLGNVIKYVWRAEEKGAPLQDLKKALWYLNREIEKRSKVATDKA